MVLCDADSILYTYILRFRKDLFAKLEGALKDKVLPAEKEGEEDAESDGSKLVEHSLRLGKINI